MADCPVFFPMYAQISAKTSFPFLFPDICLVTVFNKTELGVIDYLV